MPTFDVVVIGAGSTGENVAGRVANSGLTVAIVEHELVGGECSYYACIPSKALLRPVHVLTEAPAVAGAKHAAAGTLDVAAVFARRDRFVGDWDDSGALPWLDQNGIHLVRGHARFTGDRALTVRGKDGSATELTANIAVAVCTGSAPAIPDVQGLRDASPWTSREATAARRVPVRLAVLGGGAVACEMAMAFQTFGSEVTLVVRGERPLRSMESFAGDAVCSALQDAGVRVMTNTLATRVARSTDGTVDVHLDDGSTLHADELLVATGREPRTSDLGLEHVGLEPDGWLDVDDHMCVRGVRGEWLYAAGDVTHRARLTHMGKYQARIAGDVIVRRATGGSVDDAEWSPHTATADHRAIPQVIFTQPEVATVGLTEARARDEGLPVRVVDHDIDIAGARLFGDLPTGRARMVVDTDRRVLLGMTVVGFGVAELLHAATVAVAGEVSLDRLWHAVPAFPTISEIWLRLLEALEVPADAT
jgi:dihydrolipoamide dehydrogenase